MKPTLLLPSEGPMLPSDRPDDPAVRRATIRRFAERHSTGIVDQATILLLQSERLMLLSNRLVLLSPSKLPIERPVVLTPSDRCCAERAIDRLNSIVDRATVLRLPSEGPYHLLIARLAILATDRCFIINPDFSINCFFIHIFFFPQNGCFAWWLFPLVLRPVLLFITTSSCCDR